MAASNIVSLFRPRQVNRDWNNQELAEFYRVEGALISVGFRVDTDRGLSDEGDPWFIFADANTGDVIVHCARIDGAYLIASRAFDSVLRGMDFRSLVETFLANQPAVLPATGGKKQGNVSLHPSVLLVALVATAFFKLTSTEADAAEADEADDNDSAGDGHNETGDGLEFDRQQALVVLAAVAVVTGQLHNDFASFGGWPLLSVVADGEVSSASVSRHDNVRVSQDMQTQAADRTGGGNDVSHASADAYITRYSAGGAMPDFLIANEFGVAETDFGASSGLNSSGGNHPAAAGAPRDVSGDHHQHGPGDDSLRGTASRLAVPVSETTETPSGETAQEASPIVEGGSSVAPDTPDQSVSLALAGSISLPRVKISGNQIIVAPAVADDRSSASSEGAGSTVPDIVKVSPEPQVLPEQKAETAPVAPPAEKQPEPEITFDAKAILKDISPFLNVALHRVKYTDDIHAFNETAQHFITNFMRAEGNVATYTNGLDVVIYDKEMPISPRIDINLVTWSLDDGSTISLIGVFDYHPVV